MKKYFKILIIILLLLAGGIFCINYFLPSPDTFSADGTDTLPRAENTLPTAGQEIVNGKDVATGLMAADGLLMVKSNCIACHSSALILQNRFTREGWKEKIEWMQETQGLWDLGKNEAAILDYLAAHYSPEAAISSRRRPLGQIEWYRLEN